MVKLEEHFEEIENTINFSNDKSTIEDLGSKIEDQLINLQDPVGSYLGDMPPKQRRVAENLLEGLIKTTRLLQTIHQRSPLEKPANNIDGIQIFEAISQTTPPAFVAAMLGMFAGPLISIAGGVFAGLITYRMFTTNDKSEKTIVLESVSVDKNSINSWLKESFELIDSITEDPVFQVTAQPVVEPEKTLADFPDILTYFQKLLGETKLEEQDVPGSVRRRIQLLPKLLQAHGIEARYFDSDQDSQKQDFALWEYEKNPDSESSDFQGLAPALLRDKEVLLRGRVSEPENLNS